MDQEAEAALIDAFVAALQEVPGVSAHVREREAMVGSSRSRVDALVDATVGNRPLLLLVEAKQTAFPRDVREAVWQLRNHLAHLQASLAGQSPLAFIVAAALSPGAREALRQDGVGYYDLGGSLFIPEPGAFVFIDKPPPKNKARALGSIFRGRRAQVLQTLFAHRHDWVSVKDVAEESTVSPAMVSQTLTEMERRDWVEVRGAGPAKMRRLSDPGPVLDDWSRFLQTQPRPRMKRYFVPSPTTEALLGRLSQVCEQEHATYEITAEAAAQLYAPFLTQVSQVRCRLLANGSSRAVLERLDARPVSEGWNLGILESRSPAEFSYIEWIDGLALASPLQTYLDLQQTGGRSKELAEHLRASRLGM